MLRKKFQFQVSQDRPKRRTLYELFRCKPQERVSLKELFRYANWCDYMIVIFGLIGTVLMSQGWCFCTVLLGKSVDIYQKYEVSRNLSGVGNNNNNDDEATMEFKSQTITLIYFSLLSTVLYFVGSFMSIYLFRIFSVRQTERLKIRFFGQILRQNIDWHEQQDSGAIASMIINDFKVMENGINENLAFLIYRILSAGLNIGLALAFGWEMTMIILCTIVLTIIPFSILIQLQSTFVQRSFEAAMRANSIIEQAISGIRTVFAYGGQENERQSYKTALDIGIVNSRSRDTCIALSSSFNWFFICLGLSIGIYFGMPLLYTKPSQYTISTLIIVFLCLTNFNYCIVYGTPQFEALQLSRAAAARIYQTIKQSSTIDSSSCTGWQLKDYKCDIELKNVYFRYPSRMDVEALKDVCIKIRSGETVALVGPSGCGKSTVLRLLQRFYDVSSGDIILDETNLKLMNVGWLRSQISLLGHDSMLFDLTIEQNIRLGLPIDEIHTASMDRVMKAAKDANAHEFITRLPEGYGTVVGERGFQLSGGQRQRIAVARMLIGNPRILLLDEAASALDIKSEQIVQAALNSAAECRTTIVVTHRLSTIRNADRIIVMDAGSVVNSGTHEQLLHKCPVYARLVRAQQLYIPSNAAQYSRYLKSLRSWSSSSQAIESLDYDEHLKLEESFVKSFPVKRLWATVAPDRHLIIAAFSCSIIFGFGTTIFSFIIGGFIDQTSELAPNDYDSMMQKAIKFSLQYLCLAVAGFMINLFQVVLFGSLVARLSARLRVDAFHSILRQEMAWFDNVEHTPGAVCSILSNHAASIQSLTGLRLSIICKSITTLFGAFLLSMLTSWILTLTMLIVVPLVALCSFVETITMSRLIRDECRSSQKSVKIVVEAMNAIRTIVSLHKEEYFLRRFCRSLEKHTRSVQSRVWIKALVMSGSFVMQLSIHTVSFAVGGLVMVRTGVTSGQFLSVVESMLFASIILCEVTILWSDLTRAKLAILSLFRLIDSFSGNPSSRAEQTNDNETMDDGSAELNGVSIDKFGRSNGNVAFHKVEFAYPKRQEFRILRGLSFSTNKGETIALVGASGCGKSTAIQLLEHFYAPSKGSIKLDDHDISQLNREWLRRQMALVSQEPILFNYSIAENIAYGNIGRSVSADDIFKAAQQANVTEFVEKLPNKFATKVGPNGTQLSAGQKQRIVIARALIRDPPILLLDDATVTLDSDSQDIVQRALEQASKGRTCIVVTHRLQTIVNAHLIVVIHNGRAVEQGTHQQLLDLRGHYFRLFQSSL